MEATVLVTKPKEAITVITINRPQAKNAVDPQTARLLYDKFLAFEDDPSQKICVFHGANGTFCSGADLKAVATSKSKESTVQVTRVDGRNQGPMGPSRLQVKKPVIAAVAGYAVAGGLELSLVADMRIVEEDAVFGVFCRRWGVPLIDGGTQRLPAIVGYGRAMDMILTGRAVEAQEALSMGLANRIVGKGEALSAAVSLAEDLLKFPYQCMLADRASLAHGVFSATSFEDGLSHEYDRGVTVLGEAVEGAAQFAAGKGRHGDFSKL